MGPSGAATGGSPRGARDWTIGPLIAPVPAGTPSPPGRKIGTSAGLTAES